MSVSFLEQAKEVLDLLPVLRVSIVFGFDFFDLTFSFFKLAGPW